MFGRGRGEAAGATHTPDPDPGGGGYSAAGRAVGQSDPEVLDMLARGTGAEVAGLEQVQESVI